MMKLSFLICVAVTCLLSAAGGEPVERGMPEFSWDTVPLYMHIRKRDAFSKDELRFLSKFPLITLEKTTGSRAYDSTDAGTIKAAKAIKALNPAAKVLFYRNVMVHYGGYSFDEKLKDIPDWSLVSRRGDDELVRQRLRAYDLSNEQLRSWWISSMAAVCESPYVDGLFLDGNVKVLTSYQERALPHGKKADVIEGYRKMMAQTRAALGPDKLMIANMIRARFDDSGLEFMDYFDGSYVEGFTHAIGRVSKADYMAKGIEAMQRAARQGKIIALTLGIGNSSMGDGIDEQVEALTDLSQASRTKLEFNLALFLIVAEKYSYLLIHDGYSAERRGKQGDCDSKLWMHRFPEYDRPLGCPLGAASRRGYLYVRRFEHADVGLDIETMRGVVRWH